MSNIQVIPMHSRDDMYLCSCIMISRNYCFSFIVLWLVAVKIVEVFTLKPFGRPCICIKCNYIHASVSCPCLVLGLSIELFWSLRKLRVFGLKFETTEFEGVVLKLLLGNWEMVTGNFLANAILMFLWNFWRLWHTEEDLRSMSWSVTDALSLSPLHLQLPWQYSLSLSICAMPGTAIYLLFFQHIGCMQYIELLDVAQVNLSFGCLKCSTKFTWTHYWHFSSYCKNKSICTR